jgi:5-methylthioribose kinase
MTNEKLKAWTEALKELSESCEDLVQAMKDTSQEMKRTKKLWRTKNKSTLVKVGLALIAFPDPTISDIVGTALVAAGTVQAGIRRRAIFVEDIPKTFQNTLKEVWNTRENL